MNLTKDGNGVTTLGYYQEVLYRKMEKKEEATVRAMGYSGAKIGRVVTVGFSSFQIEEGDGEISSIRFDDVLDIS